MFNNMLELYDRDDSNKWPNKGFGEETTLAVLIEINFTHLIWSSRYRMNVMFLLGRSRVAFLRATIYSFEVQTNELLF